MSSARLAIALSGLLLAAAFPAFAQATTGPQIDIVPEARPAAGMPLEGRAYFNLKLLNSGDEAFDAEPLRIEASVSPGFKFSAASDELSPFSETSPWDCQLSPDAGSASCDFDSELMSRHASELPIGPGKEPCVGLLNGSCRVGVTARAEPGTKIGDVLQVSIQACGGGAPLCTTESASIEVVPSFEITSFDGGLFDQQGNLVTNAGAHPHKAVTTFKLTETAAGEGFTYSPQDPKDQIVDLPPGLIVNPSFLPTCSESALSTGISAACPRASQVGFLTLYVAGRITEVSHELGFPLFNMDPPAGVPALFGLNIQGAVVHVLGGLHRADESAGGYSLRLRALNLPQTLSIVGSSYTLWGVPADPSHDPERGGASDALLAPLLTLPTSCQGPLRTEMSLGTWQGTTVTSSFLSHGPQGSLEPIGADGCDQLDFDPRFRAALTTEEADTTSGLDLELRMPQSEGPEDLATPHLRSVRVELPDGLVLDPSAATGLDGCSEEEFAADESDPASCPQASKIGKVEIETPLLSHPLEGSLYLADPHANPFGSLLAVYVAVDDDRSGITLKLAGEVQADHETGRVEAVFNQAPQLPFEVLRLTLFDGTYAPLRTPPHCGPLKTIAELEPWSAPQSGLPANVADEWQILRSTPGVRCDPPGAESAPLVSVHGGSVSDIGGATSPFLVSVRRKHGSSSLGALAVSLPPGISADLNTTPDCPEELLNPAAIDSRQHGSACPAESRVGSVTVLAGAGPRPLAQHGDVYLAGPYRGAPVSLAIIVRGIAGPFDLGSFLVRIAVRVNLRSGRLRLVSDPLPRIRSGIPLDLRELRIALDRPAFVHNPTSCDPTHINLSASAPGGATATAAARFKVSDCAALDFKPKSRLLLSGGMGRNAHPKIAVTLSSDTSAANISAASFTLPAGELLDTRRIRAVCSRDLTPGQCPEGSALGRARIWSPLLRGTLGGPIYLREPQRRLPDFVADLRRGKFRLSLHGHIVAASGGRLTLSIPRFPDLPLTKATFSLAGGDRGIVVNSATLCARPLRVQARLDAHNGKRRLLRPKVSLHGRC